MDTTIVTAPAAAASFATERAAAWDRMHRCYFPDYDQRWEQAIDRVRGSIGDTARVLDLGCGVGTLTARLSRALPSAEVVGLDRDPLLLALARSAHPDSSLSFEQGDVLVPGGIPYPSGTFGAVVSSAFVHYFDRARLGSLLRRCAELLAPGGVIVTVETFGPQVGRPNDEVSAAARPSAWATWWSDTRERAADYGFTFSEPDEAATGEEHPPLTLADYHHAVRRAGCVPGTVAVLPGGSAVVTSRVRH